MAIELTSQYITALSNKTCAVILVRPSMYNTVMPLFVGEPLKFKAGSWPYFTMAVSKWFGIFPWLLTRQNIRKMIRSKALLIEIVQLPLLQGIYVGVWINTFKFLRLENYIEFYEPILSLFAINIVLNLNEFFPSITGLFL